MEKKLDGNYTRILQAILNKSWRQHPTKHQLYGHLPPITKNYPSWDEPDMRGHRRRNRGRTHKWHTHGEAKAGRPARTYIQQLCADIGYSLEDLPGSDGRYRWQGRVREIRTGGRIIMIMVIYVLFKIVLIQYQCSLVTNS